MRFSADDLRYATETVDRIERVTNSICGEVERLFLLRLSPYTRCDSNAGAKDQLMAGARQWVKRIAKLGAQETSSNKRLAAADALAQILRTLDHVDLENLQYLSTREGIKGGKRKADASPLSPSNYSSNQRRRRWLPSSVHQRDVISGMHEAEAVDTGEEDDNPGGLFLCNPARSYHTKQSDIRPRVSMRDVLNDLPERESTLRGTNAVSTLTLDAAILRRDVYKFLAELDSAEIEACLEQEECASDKIKELASTLLERISSHLESPSMRLSAIITLDSLRELELNAMGYQSMLEELLEAATSWSIMFYAEIISECNAYDNSVLYVPALSDLMERALKMQSDDDQLQPTALYLLRAIRHTIVRRHRLLSSLSDANKSNSMLRREIDAYRVLCDRMSARFDSVSDWIHPEMSRREREQAISILQGEGILSMFCEEECGDDTLALLWEPLHTEEDYPFANDSSLRASHARMGPLDGVNRLISGASAYEQKVVPADAATTAAPLPSNLLQLSEGASTLLTSAGDDILRTILSFLGHRSLARASQCCKSWQSACNATNLWAALYFSKWRKACFEEEMAAQVDNAKDDAHVGRFLSLGSRAERKQLAINEEGYDWKHLFMNKHLTEKVYKLKTCTVVGCLHLARRGDHQMKAHLKRHRSNLVAQSKKRRSYNGLQTKVARLREEMAILERGDVQVTTTMANAQTDVNIDGPEAILKHLVFPYLEVKDIVKSVCKLWTHIARSDQIWEGLYRRRFEPPSIPESQSTTARDWKQLFREAFVAHRNVRGHVTHFGWPVRICPTIGCNKELRSSFEFDWHVLKHEEKDCLCRVKLLKKLQREQKRHERSAKGRCAKGRSHRVDS